MKNNATEHVYKDIVERYCCVIGENTAIIRRRSGEKYVYECLAEPKCRKSIGGCKNEKYLYG